MSTRKLRVSNFAAVSFSSISLDRPKEGGYNAWYFFTDFVVFENKNQHLCFSVVWVLKSTFNSFSAKFFQEISLDNNCLTNPRILYWFIFLEKRGKHSRWRCHQAHDSRQSIWTTLSRGIWWWSMFAFIYWVEFHVLAVTARNWEVPIMCKGDSCFLSFFFVITIVIVVLW